MTNTGTVAFHEAGHAVLYWVVMHRPPKLVTIVPTKGALGCVINGVSPLRGINSASTGEAQWMDIRSIMIFIAGSLAVRRAFPRSRYGRLAGSDFEAAFESAWCATDSPVRACALLDALAPATAHLLGIHWHRVERVAARLLRDKALNGAAVLEEIQGAASARG
jgi:hypothetical protein